MHVTADHKNEEDAARAYDRWVHKFSQIRMDLVNPGSLFVVFSQFSFSIQISVCHQA